MTLLEINNRIVICEANISRLKHSSIYHESEIELRMQKLNKELDQLEAEKKKLINQIEVVGLVKL